MGEAKLKRALNGSAGLVGPDGRPLLPSGQTAKAVDTRTKVMIGLPAPEHMMVQTALCLLNAAVFAMSHQIVIWNVVHEMGASISFQRNALAGLFLNETQADYLLMIDSDMQFPKHALLQLISHGKDIVGATYSRKRPPYEILGMPEQPADGISPPMFQGPMQKMEYMPAGFMLIARKALERIPPPWFEERWDANQAMPFVSEDYGFCLNARGSGLDVWCDMDLSFQMGHIGHHSLQLPRPAGPPPAEMTPPAEAVPANANA